jgi:cytochrome P450
MSSAPIALDAGLHPDDAAALPPGPTMPPLLLMLRMARRPFELLDECARRFGDCFTLRGLGGPPAVLFSHPDAIRDVWAADGDALRAGEAAADLLVPILGTNALLVLDGARHRRERRLLSPPFHGERIQVYGDLVRDITDRVMAGWPCDRRFPLHAAMQAITLDVIIRAVFGVDDPERLAGMRDRLLRFLAMADGPSAAFLALPFTQVELGGLSPWGRFVRRRRAVDALLFGEIARRRRLGTPGRTDILALLIDARDEEGRAMSDQELRDELFTVLMAGHETTATSLAWIFYHVLPRADVLDRLRAELARVVGDGPIRAEHLGALEYLDAVVKEAMRLTPVISFVGRRLHAPMRIGGVALPAGVVASPCMYLTHRRPDVWPEPLRFRPERFLGLRPSPQAFYPFGGGLRRCLGAAFATFEMKIVTAQVLMRTALRIAPGYRMRVVRRAVTHAPSEGVPVVQARRPVLR